MKLYIIKNIFIYRTITAFKWALVCYWKLSLLGKKKVIERMNGVNFKREYMIEVFDDNFVYANSLLISRNSLYLYIIPANSDACK